MEHKDVSQDSLFASSSVVGAAVVVTVCVVVLPLLENQLVEDDAVFCKHTLDED